MKRNAIYLFALLLMMSCGSKDNSKTEDVQSAKTETSSVEAQPSPEQAQSDEYIISRVEAIYSDVFGEYYNENEDDLASKPNPDEKYCSEDWNNTVEKVNEYDQVHNPDDIGFFEADYWVMGQDCQDLSVSDITLEEKKSDRATVKLNLHNSGSVIPVRLNLVFERGNWFIDNFIDENYDFDWKSEMQLYLKEG